jgi:thiamine-monophosphate kinase
MKLQQLGEYGLVGRITRRLKNSSGQNIILGPGDDCFAAYVPAGAAVLGTTDMLIENRHFRRKWASPQEIGYKAMAVNISDLAAMGGCKNANAMVAIGLPKNTSVSFVDNMYIGMHKCAQKYEVSILGGDTVSSNKDIVISISLVGYASADNIVKRSGAHIGDIICVTGTFGDAYAGLSLLEKSKKCLKNKPHWMRKLINSQLIPEPRMREAIALSSRGLASAMIDSSDGLAASVSFIAKESKKGAIINLEDIPVSDSFVQWAEASGCKKYHDAALFGGEEYELVFTVQTKNLPKVQKLIPKISVVGKITSGNGLKYLDCGKPVAIPSKTFEHFA